MTSFDREAEDVGNVLALEHVNLTVPDLNLAALFYVTGLGFTRDPYIDFGTRNMWVNAGEQQFHLPVGKPQIFRGHLSAVVPDLDGLMHRLGGVSRALGDTLFAFHRCEDHVQVTCPWGNQIRVYGPGAFAAMTLGLPRLDVQVGPGAAAGIAAFYRQVMACPVTLEGGRALVRVGYNQTLAFSEAADPPPDYDGHHIAIYVANFSAPHRCLLERGLITEESNQHQYRFQAIVDPDSGDVLAELEHEVRSMTHPLYRRCLVNRNPGLDFFNFRKGNEVYTPG
jgi:catechol-2,3-dioxygenase